MHLRIHRSLLPDYFCTLQFILSMHYYQYFSEFLDNYQFHSLPEQGFLPKPEITPGSV